jgi:hypothetical protein
VPLFYHLYIITTTIAGTMPPKRARKAPAALIESIELVTAIPVPGITLGEEILHAETDELSPSSPTCTTYPSPPSPPRPTRPDEASDSEDNKDESKLAWSEEMLEQLVEELYDVFTKGGGADNSFKKSTFQSAAKRIRKVYKGKIEVIYAKCKNKWADLKRKWQHWVILSGQSGIGWNEETELYDFYDYVWDNLNKSHLKIIWYKTHVMPLRDLIGTILHDVQANGEESVSLNKPTLIDPRLYTIDAAQALSTASPAPSLVLKPSKTPYNKSKKRTRVDTADNSDNDGTLPLAAKKIDLGAAFMGLSEEMAKGRKAKEEHLTVHKKALKLLEKEYKKRMDIMVFIQACSFLKDERNATTFTTLLDSELRDRWLEIELPTELLPCEL